MKTSGLAVTLFCMLCYAAFLADAQSPDPTLVENPVFKNECAKCHGKTAQGRHFAGPSLASDKVRGVSNEDLQAIILNGKGRMPKFAGKLTPEEISTVVQQIKALNTK